MRTPAKWARRRPGRVLSALGALVVSALLLGILGFGYGTIPALGPALDPGRGAWTSAYDGTPVTSQALHVPGLTPPYAAVAVVVTLLLAALQTLAGAWLARAFAPPRWSTTSGNLAAQPDQVGGVVARPAVDR